MIIDVETPEGPGKFYLAQADDPRALLILGHGAGGGVDALDLSVLASRLPKHGITVARFEQPWRTAGKKVASRPPKLDIAWNAGVTALLSKPKGPELVEGPSPEHPQGPELVEGPLADLPLYVGGRSAGARVACRTAPGFDQLRGVVCCAFPLHPPGRPDRSRADELLGAGVPRLVVQGERDSFGGPDEVRQAVAGDDQVTIIEVPGADHSMKTAKNGPATPAEVRELITASVIDFVR